MKIVYVNRINKTNYFCIIIETEAIKTNREEKPFFFLLSIEKFERKKEKSFELRKIHESCDDKEG